MTREDLGDVPVLHLSDTKLIGLAHSREPWSRPIRPPRADGASHSSQASRYSRGVHVLRLGARTAIPEALIAPGDADVACVFVHGFNGSAVDSWSGFRELVLGGDSRTSNVDFYFFTYDSRSAPIVTTARALLDELQHLFDGATDITQASTDPDAAPRNYRSMTLVGHSLGGVIIRRAVALLRHAADEMEPNPFEAAVLDSAVRLFAPAQGGVLLTGWTGLLGGGRPMSLAARKWRTVAELTRPSQVLEQLERRTGELAENGMIRSARANTVWAGNEDVVESGYDYDLDPPSLIELGRSHSGVCKPRSDYGLPFDFVCASWS